MTYYYLHPSPEGLVGMAAELAERGILQRDNASGGLVGFFTEVFRQNPDKLAIWIRELERLDEGSRLVLWNSLWNSDTPEARVEIRKLAQGPDKTLINRITLHPPIDPRTIEITHPGTLDLLWGSFSASGDPAFVRRITEVLAWPDPQPSNTNGDFARFLIKRAAKWSLSSNMQQHKKVAEIVRAELAMSEGIRRAELARIVSHASSAHQ